MYGDRLIQLTLFSAGIWGSCMASINLAQLAPVIIRVTGGNPSNILGKLGVNGNANLFLLNPNGILFGENASLDVQSSFVATTADSFFFKDGVSYSATNPEAPPMLSIRIPEGVQFGSNAGSIEVRGTRHQLDFDSSTLTPTGYNLSPSGLEVSKESTLALLGEEINLNSGNLTASGGTIELAAIAQSGRVDIDTDGKALEFDYKNITNYGDVNLNLESSLYLNISQKSGNILLRGKDISLKDGSTIIGRKVRSNKKGQINIFATDSLNIVNDASDTFPSGIFTLAERNAGKNGANLNLEATNLNLENNALIVSSTSSKADGGNINVVAQQADFIDRYDLPFNAGIYSQVLSGAKGDGGIITVELDALRLLNGQTVTTIDDEDDLENIIGEDRAEDLEDFAEENEDKNAIIAPLRSGERTIVLQQGGQITSRNRGAGANGVAIVTAETIQFWDASELDVKSETPDVVVEQPEIEAELEIPEINLESDLAAQTPELVEQPDVELETPDVVVEQPEIEAELETETPDVVVEQAEQEESELVNEFAERIYVFDLDNGQTFVVDAEELEEVAESASIASSEDSTEESEPVKIFIDSILVTKAEDPNFDLYSACQIGDSNFVSINKGGIPENPFNSLIQSLMLPDLDTSSITNKSALTGRPNQRKLVSVQPIVEAEKWKINQNGEVELVAMSPGNSEAIADVPSCLQHLR